MPRHGKVLHTAQARSRGGRENGIARSFDGLLDLRLSTPHSARIGTNPEQLLAASWSASFESSIGIVARERGVVLPADRTVEAKVSLNLGDDGCFFSVEFRVGLDGLDPLVARALVDEARKICPFSKATRNNIDVVITVS